MMLKEILESDYRDMALEREWDDIQYLSQEEVLEMCPSTDVDEEIVWEKYDQFPSDIFDEFNLAFFDMQVELEKLKNNIEFLMGLLESGELRSGERTEIRADLSADKREYHRLLSVLEGRDVHETGNELVRRVPSKRA